MSSRLSEMSKLVAVVPNAYGDRPMPPSLAPGALGRSAYSVTPTSKAFGPRPLSRLTKTCAAGLVSASGTGRPAIFSSTARGMPRSLLFVARKSSTPPMFVTSALPSKLGVPHP